MSELHNKEHDITYHNNHNVFILGAGFSTGAGLPTMRNFIPAMRHAVSWAEENGFNDLRDDIIRSLVLRKNSASAAYRCKIDPNNIEDIFSLYAGGLQITRGRHNKSSIQRAIAATLEFKMSYYRTHAPLLKLSIQPHIISTLPEDYINSLKSGDSDTQKIIPLYQAIASVLSNGLNANGLVEKPTKNTIITFNYDTLLEESLESISAPYNLGITSENIDIDSDSPHLNRGQPLSELSILKLHGSSNWAVSFNTHTDSHQRNDKTYPSIKIYRNATELFTDQAHEYDQMILEPPTWNKGSNAPILQQLWDKSIEALSTATTIFIIGYSMPESDMHFKYLMAFGLSNNISLEKVIIINPAFGQEIDSGPLKARVFKIFREEHEAENSLQMISCNASDFILAAGKQKKIDPNFLPFILNPGLDHSFFSGLQ